MAQSREFEKLEEDFLSGKNPLAYLPLCRQLRRQKAYARALELCQRGLAGDPNSIAGRTLYCRLLSDLGHYEDSLREIQRAETQAPDAQGLQKEKTRCLLRLNRPEEAETVLNELISRNPVDPEVQMLTTQLRRHRAQTTVGSPSSENEVRFLRLSNREILEKLLEEMRPHVKMICCAVIPIGGGEPALEGDAMAAEAGYHYFRGVSKTCEEMEEGLFRVGLLETEKSQLIVLVRKKTLVALCIEPTAKFGKIYHRFVNVVSQLLPEAAEGARP